MFQMERVKADRKKTSPNGSTSRPFGPWCLTLPGKYPFRMAPRSGLDAQDVATQLAMAEEIRVRLAIMGPQYNRAWLEREAGISAPSYGRYFVKISRPVPLSAIQAIASVLGMSTGELITLAEKKAPKYEAEMMAGASEAERNLLREAIEAADPTSPRSRRTARRARPDTGS